MKTIFNVLFLITLVLLTSYIQTLYIQPNQPKQALLQTQTNKSCSNGYKYCYYKGPKNWCCSPTNTCTDLANVNFDGEKYVTTAAGNLCCHGSTFYNDDKCGGGCNSGFTCTVTQSNNVNNFRHYKCCWQK
jgi:hypothetical protein